MEYKDDGSEWDWQGEAYSLQNDSSYIAQNEDLSFMFEETTPVKGRWDLAYHDMQSYDREKESEQRRETSSRVKRRRMLQFDHQMMDSSLFCEEMSSTFLKSTESEDSIEEIIPEISQWVSGFHENVPASNHKDLDGSTDSWLAECFDDTQMNFIPEDMNMSGASNVQIDMTDFCTTPSRVEANMVQHHVTRTPCNVVFKDKKSYIRTPMKLASSVAYPFAFIKPSGAHGDVTLNDINRRIHTPPSKLKQNDDPSAYPTSALTGKPVVGKTKIRTEGGKGSITIMRTKG